MGAEEEREWMRGYAEGRRLCLTDGVEAALKLSADAGTSRALAAGLDWAIWDWQDANGLPHGQRIQRGA